MAKFESPLGTQRFGGIAGGGLKEFTIPDESGFTMPDEKSILDFQAQFDNVPSEEVEELSRVEQEMKEARHARKFGKERLSDGARRRIEKLIGLTTLTRQATVADQTYTFQSLSGQEIREAYVFAAEFDGTIQFAHELRRQLVARSLIQIAGLDIDQFLGSNSLESKFALLDKLPDALLQRLFVEYQILVKENNDKFEIKTEAEAREVREDLKK